jgi:6-phosphogluconolactonase (cycloisomerase 2 family)
MLLVRSLLAAAAALAVPVHADEGKTAPHPEFVYVTHRVFGPAFVSALRANPATGQLTPVPGSPFPSVELSWDVKVDRRNRFAFVTETQPAALSIHAIAPTTGALSLLSVSELGFDPRALALHPTQPFLYAADIGLELHARRFDETTGAVTPIPGSPFPGPNLASGIVVDPNGRFLYIVELQTFSGTFDGSVWSYAIDAATGALTPIGVPQPTGVRTRDLAIDPLGHHLYAASGDSADIAAFAVDGASGLLTPLPEAPFPAVSDVRSLAMARDGRFLYAVSKAAHTVLTYARDAATGALTPQGKPLDLPEAPEHVALDCTGRFLYVSHGDPVNAVSVVRIDPATGATALASGAALPQASTYGITATSFSCPISPR